MKMIFRYILILVLVVSSHYVFSQINSGINPYKKESKIIIKDSEKSSHSIWKEISEINKDISKLGYDKTTLEFQTRKLGKIIEEAVIFNDNKRIKISEFETALSNIKDEKHEIKIEREKLSIEREKLSAENEILKDLVQSIKRKNEKDTLVVEDLNNSIKAAVDKIGEIREFERTPHNIGLNVGNSTSSFHVSAEYLYRRKSKGNLGLIASIGLDTGEAIFFGLGAKIFLYPSNNDFDPFLKLLASRNIKTLHDDLHYNMLYEATIGTQYNVSRKFILNGSLGLNFGSADTFDDTFFVGRFGVIINIFTLN